MQIVLIKSSRQAGKFSINQIITPSFLTYLAEDLSSLIHLYLGITIICNIFGWKLFNG